MKKFKILTLLLAVAVSAFSLTGCLPDGSENSNNDDNSNITDISGNEIRTPDGDNEQTPPVDNGDDKKPDGDYEQTPLPTVEVLGYADVGDRYSTVVKPIYDAAELILNDLIESGKITYKDEFFNPRITSIRCPYGRDLMIFYQYDLYIGDSGVKSEFIVQENCVELENFCDTKAARDEIYNDYRDFLITERKYEKSEKYEEVVLPLAEKVAEMFLDRYVEHCDEMEISVANYGKNIIIKANSSASELHSKLIEKINETILKIDDAYNKYYYLPEGEHYPLLTDQDIEISIGGENYKYNSLSITVNFQNFRYEFYRMPFNENDEFSKEYLSYMQGSPEYGYAWQEEVLNDIYNPTNEEFLEFFEELDLLNIELPLGYSGIPKNYFNTLCGENTFLYF